MSSARYFAQVRLCAEAGMTSLRAFNDRTAAMPARRASLIADARESGATWRQIGDTLSMTEHGAIKASRPAAPRGRPRQE
ncbi:hypothetical protein B7R54_07180 [Subtercola boreus]|uniref:Uncharacterized protein n=1 Tax=Subtercola boreus TaxID=120213 RepID=A0A3E0VI16_9MICO|nr:hypothetical protein B7R54_07180 [Subtercola boreus]